MPEFVYGSEPPKPVPSIKPEFLADGVTLVQPLTRKGVGPGLIVLDSNKESDTPVEIEDGIPSLRMKWAEEGYCVVEIRPAASSSALKIAVSKLLECHECESKEKMGLVCYDMDMWSKSASAMELLRDRISCAVLYADGSQYSVLSSQASVPTLYHLTGSSKAKRSTRPGSRIFEYESRDKCNFAVPFHEDFHYATEAVSHSRNLSFIKPIMGGPYFDLELLWEEHTYYEFVTRNVEHTMATMVQEPYVNHIPTMTGGIGRANLTAFYRDHFIFSNPDDAELELISRTVGIDRVVDEFSYNFTHDRIIDWLLPGVPPTGRKMKVAMMAVVNIRGDRLYHEHIHWDSASALKQASLLPETATLSVAGTEAAVTGDGTDVNGHAAGKKYEVRLPVVGAEGVKKMMDKNSVASNEMFAFQPKEL